MGGSGSVEGGDGGDSSDIWFNNDDLKSNISKYPVCNSKPRAQQLLSIESA